MKARNAGTRQPALWPTTIGGDANDSDNAKAVIFKRRNAF
jgi:hypothetical protein